jgi:uncharacterized protein YdaU (DUF1376 family)
MTAFNEMVLDTNAYLADTHHLSAQEHGAYLLLLIEMSRSADGWIDDGILRQVCRVKASHWKAVRATLAPFLIERDGKVSQKRIQRQKARLPKLAILGNSAAGMPLANKESSLLPLSLVSDSESSLTAVNRKTKKLCKTLREDWQPTIANLDYAKQHGFDKAGSLALAEAFADNHRSKGNRMADWDAAWRTWVRNEIKFNRGAKGGGNGSNGKSAVDAWDRLRGRFEGDAGGGEGQANLLRIR